MTDLGKLHVVNGPLPRRSMVTAGLGFKPGQWDGTGHIFVDGTTIAGVRNLRYYQDGSVRSCAVDVPVRVDGNEEVWLDVEAGPGNQERFSFHPSVDEMSPLWRVVPRGYQLVRSEWAERTATTWRIRTLWRKGPMWADLSIQLHSGLPTARWGMRWGFSDPRIPDLRWTDTPMELEVVGPRPTCWNSRSRLMGETYVHPNKWVMRLDTDHEWGDGQALFACGELLFHGRENTPEEHGTLAAAMLELPMFAMHGGWRDTLVPYAEIPDRRNSGARNLDIDEAIRQFHRGDDPWDAPGMTMAVYPGQTGAQPDFGVFNQYLWRAISSDTPELLFPLLRDCLGECRRPTTHMESDVRPFRAATHPEAYLFVERPHPHSWSPDHLGKPERQELGSGYRGWVGYDAQHYSKNWVLTALVTGDPWLYDYCDQQAELIKSRLRSDTPSNVLNQVGSPRTGRMMHAATNLFLVTGDDELLQAIENRVRTTYKNNWDNGEGQTPPQYLGVHLAGPDPRYLAGENRWICWEVAQLLLGLEAARMVMGDIRAHDALSNFMPIYVQHLADNSWRKTGEGQWENATAISDPGGTWLPGPFATWSLPAAQLAARSGDGRAKEIVASVKRTADGWWSLD